MTQLLEIFSFLGIDWGKIGYHLYQLGIAFALSLPVALNREHNTHSAGLRTFPIVSLASCAFMLVGMEAFEGSDAGARVMYGIITGIGFIGGGAILKSRGNVLGTATAASLWNTGAIGVSVAFLQYEIAILLSIINFVILRFAKPLKRQQEEEKAWNEEERQSKGKESGEESE